VFCRKLNCERHLELYFFFFLLYVFLVPGRHLIAVTALLVYIRIYIFYGLLKIHKSEIIQEIVDPGDLQFRPIIAGSECKTSRLSSLLDQFLKPFLKNVPSYVRDDIDFLNFIPKQEHTNTKLVSFDMVDLYTNIPHALGRELILP